MKRVIITLLIITLIMGAAYVSLSVGGPIEMKIDGVNVPVPSTEGSQQFAIIEQKPVFCY